MSTVKVGQVWRDKDKRRNTVIEIVGSAYSDAEGHIAIGLVVGTEEERTYKVERLTERWELVIEKSAPVVWDERGSVVFLAEHDHVHNAEGVCIKNRYDVRCDAPKKATQKTYMRKVVSTVEPSYFVRMTIGKIEEFGLPVDPWGVQMELEK